VQKGAKKLGSKLSMKRGSSRDRDAKAAALQEQQGPPGPLAAGMHSASSDASSSLPSPNLDP